MPLMYFASCEEGWTNNHATLLGSLRNNTSDIFVHVTQFDISLAHVHQNDQAVSHRYA